MHAEIEQIEYDFNQQIQEQEQYFGERIKELENKHIRELKMNQDAYTELKEQFSNMQMKYKTVAKDMQSRPSSTSSLNVTEWLEKDMNEEEKRTMRRYVQRAKEGKGEERRNRSRYKGKW